MTIRGSDWFSFDGISSIDMGITSINVNDGMQEEPFLATRELVEVKIPGKDKPYFQRMEEQPLEFEVSFMFNEPWDQAKIRQVARWLLQDYYKPLFFSDNINRIFYAIVDGDSKLIHNCLSQGYVTLRFRCDSPYAYSPVYTSQEFYMTPKYLTKTESTTANFQSGTLTDVEVQP
jgi:predicted phage tail component-like protein